MSVQVPTCKLTYSKCVLWVMKWAFVEMCDCGLAHRVIISLHIQLSEDTSGPAQTPVALRFVHSLQSFPKCLLYAKSYVRHCNKGEKKERTRGLCPQRSHHII